MTQIRGAWFLALCLTVLGAMPTGCSFADAKAECDRLIALDVAEARARRGDSPGYESPGRDDGRDRRYPIYDPIP